MNKEITREALLHLRGVYEIWLRLKLTTDTEKELAELKIKLIDNALKDMG